MRNLIDRAMEQTPTRGFSFILGLAMLLWSLLVLNPFTYTFGAEFYSALAYWAQEEVWGTAFLVGGITMLWGVCTRSIGAVRIGANFGFVLWLLIAILYATTNIALTPIATTSCVALMHAWLFWQVRIHPTAITHDFESVQTKPPRKRKE